MHTALGIFREMEIIEGIIDLNILINAYHPRLLFLVSKIPATTRIAHARAVN